MHSGEANRAFGRAGGDDLHSRLLRIPFMAMTMEHGRQQMQVVNVKQHRCSLLTRDELERWPRPLHLPSCLAQTLSCWASLVTSMARMIVGWNGPQYFAGYAGAAVPSWTIFSCWFGHQRDAQSRFCCGFATVFLDAADVV